MLATVAVKDSCGEADGWPTLRSLLRATLRSCPSLEPKTTKRVATAAKLLENQPPAWGAPALDNGAAVVQDVQHEEPAAAIDADYRTCQAHTAKLETTLRPAIDFRRHRR